MQCPKWNNKRKATLSLWELRYTVIQSLRVSIYQISCINRPQLYLERLGIRSSARNRKHRTFQYSCYGIWMRGGIMFTKKQKIWLWVADDRNQRQIVYFELGLHDIYTRYRLLKRMSIKNITRVASYSYMSKMMNIIVITLLSPIVRKV